MRFYDKRVYDAAERAKFVEIVHCKRPGTCTGCPKWSAAVIRDEKTLHAAILWANAIAEAVAELWGEDADALVAELYREETGDSE